MGHYVREQFHHVPVRQGILDMFSMPFANDEVLRTQYPEALRNNREGFAFRQRKLRYVRRSLRKKNHDPQTLQVANRSKHPCRALQCTFIELGNW